MRSRRSGRAIVSDLKLQFPNAPAQIIAVAFLEVPFSTDFSAPRCVWKKLFDNKKVVIVVDGKGVMGNGFWGNVIGVSRKQFL